MRYQPYDEGGPTLQEVDSMTESRYDTRELDASDYGGAAGYFDEAGQCQYVLPGADRWVDDGRGGLVIGLAGVDGIHFVLRPGDAAVYAHFPMEDRLERLAPGFDAFIRGWLEGSVTV